MSQESFAAHSGIARSYMSRIEVGDSNVSLDAIEKLAAALGVEVAELFVPASTSSNTSVWTSSLLANTALIASMTRDISPPEAI